MKKPMINTLAGATAGLMLFAYTGSAQLITYVDATHGGSGNTSILISEQWEQFDPFIGEAASDDGNWDFREDFGNDGIYQNAAWGVANSSGADSNPLRTTVTGLAEDEYNVYLYFWDAMGARANGPWQIRATLNEADETWTRYAWDSEGAFLFHTGANGTIMSADLDGGNPFTTNVVVSEADRRLVQVHLGTVTGTSFSVFVDDGPAIDGEDRTWYDGVGYSVVPEPSTYALLAGLGALAFIVIRRRFRR